VTIANENDIRIKRLAGKIDRVLVDAPCSGLGTLRRNPDLKWRQTAEGVAELARKQHDILKGASRLVKKGGRLVYATCSILPEENEAIVAAFLAAHADFRQVSAQEILAQQGIALDCGETLRTGAAHARHRRILCRGAGAPAQRPLRGGDRLVQFHALRA
jgi:16S rRNA (cytosine967-C5)-methyltransferase